jgi:hypothetical protein
MALPSQGVQCAPQAAANDTASGGWPGPQRRPPRQLRPGPRAGPRQLGRPVRWLSALHPAWSPPSTALARAGSGPNGSLLGPVLLTVRRRHKTSQAMTPCPPAGARIQTRGSTITAPPAQPSHRQQTRSRRLRQTALTGWPGWESARFSPEAGLDGGPTGSQYRPPGCAGRAPQRARAGDTRLVRILLPRTGRVLRSGVRYRAPSLSSKRVCSGCREGSDCGLATQVKNAVRSAASSAGASSAM